MTSLFISLYITSYHQIVSYHIGNRNYNLQEAFQLLGFPSDTGDWSNYMVEAPLCDVFTVTVGVFFLVRMFYSMVLCHPNRIPKKCCKCHEMSIHSSWSIIDQLGDVWYHSMSFHPVASLVQTLQCLGFCDQEISLAYRRQCLRGHPSRGGSARNYLKLQAR